MVPLNMCHNYQKEISILRFRNPTYGKFAGFSELESPNDIGNSAILIVPVFKVTFCIRSSCMPKIYMSLGVKRAFLPLNEKN